MRPLMIFFGLLDVGIVVTYCRGVPQDVSNLSHQPILTLVCLFVMASLVASAYGLLRDRHWVFILNYILFPFRLLLAFLSLIWLAFLVLPAQPSILLNEVVYGFAVAFEGVRLGLTIMLHVERRRQQHNHPLQWTGPGVNAVQAS
ncbi:MAG TPA: hypothetical protein VF624_08340 [Tepidisphaeraceae bacterium]|jgi:hypothetical protein